MPHVLQDSLGQLIQQYKRHIRSAVNAKELGLTGMHVHVINTLVKCADTPCTANDLAVRLNRDKAQIARLLKDLSCNGLIKREPNPNDQRSQLLVLTKSATQLTQKIKQAEQAIKTQMQQGLSADELRMFDAVISKMVENLKRQ